MNAKIISQGILKSILWLFLITLGGYTLYLLRPLLSYLIIAAIVSLIGRPIVLFFNKRLKFSTTLSSMISISILLLIIFGIFSLFVPILVQQGENISLLNINNLENTINKLFSNISIYFSWEETNWKKWLTGQDWVKNFNLSVIPDFLNSFIGWISGVTIGLFCVLFISFFLLKDSALLENVIFSFIKEKHHSKLKKSLLKIKNLLSRYFIGLLIQIGILLVIYSGFLLLNEVPNAFIIAFLCALLNLIPYIGPIFGAVLMLLLTMTSDLNADFSNVILPRVSWVMIGFVFGQLIDNFFSQPIIFSNSVKSHPLEIFIVIIAAGLLFGTIGLVFAIPFYTALKVIFKEFLFDNNIVKSLTKDI